MLVNNYSLLKACDRFNNFLSKCFVMSEYSTQSFDSKIIHIILGDN